MVNIKKELGQFYTEGNPFKHHIFNFWLAKIMASHKDLKFLEPFAGSNNIPKMVMELDKQSTNINWSCFDIAPGNNVLSNEQFPIIKRDVLFDFPIFYDVIITNPPYLAKNSATRSGETYPDTEYDDLYKFCLEKCLDNAKYVAVIVPNSFLTAGLFHNRLYCVISLVNKMFSDTDCPVCLALFVPETVKPKLKLGQTDFSCYRNEKRLGLFSELVVSNTKYMGAKSNNWKFNDPTGNLGLKALDTTNGKTIEAICGEQLVIGIPASNIKISSRTATRISGIPTGVSVSDLVIEFNKTLHNYRNDTCDIFLTSFKGLRKDGDYRRRLDWKIAGKLLDYSVEQLLKQ